MKAAESSAVSRPSVLASFTRSQVTSLAATLADFGVLIFLVEVLGIWYVLATAFGALAGAVTSFLAGRHWSFEAASGALRGQALRYSLVSGLSLLLNTSGVYLFTDLVGLPYVASKALIAFLVGVFFNFPLHRHFVFR